MKTKRETVAKAIRLFFVQQNHALDAWYGKNYIVEKDKKTPLLYNESAVANCTNETTKEVVQNGYKRRK